MLLAVGDPIPLSVYFHPSEAILTVRATVTTRNPYSIIVDDVALEAIPGAPGLFGIEVDSMPDAAFVDVFYYSYQAGITDYVSTSTEQFGRLDLIKPSAYDSEPLIGIIPNETLIGIVVEIN